MFCSVMAVLQFPLIIIIVNFYCHIELFHHHAVQELLSCSMTTANPYRDIHFILSSNFILDS